MLPVRPTKWLTLSPDLQLPRGVRSINELHHRHHLHLHWQVNQAHLLVRPVAWAAGIDLHALQHAQESDIDVYTVQAMSTTRFQPHLCIY